MDGYFLGTRECRKRQEGTFRDVSNVLKCSLVITLVYTIVKTYWVEHLRLVRFNVSKLYLNFDKLGEKN